jgi:hypothetical protein
VNRKQMMLVTIQGGIRYPPHIDELSLPGCTRTARGELCCAGHIEL